MFAIPEPWDEGVGYNYEEIYDYSTGNYVYDVSPSNWFNRTTQDLWTEQGIYTGTPITIETIHFDNGNEDINVDITGYVNEILSGITENYGLGLPFIPPFETISIDNEQSVTFFTKYTQTFWEPYLETVFADTIDDNRENFVVDIDRNLYLYVNYMGNPYNLDELPTVDILDYNGNVISGLSGLTATHVRKGVYEITFGLSGQLCDGKRFYYDKWCNIIINGINTDCVTKNLYQSHSHLSLV